MKKEFNKNITDDEANKRFNELQLLSEIIRKFINVKRAVLQPDGVTPETNGEHTLHVMFLAVAYAQRYHPTLNTGRIAEFVMVHDLVEVYAGDTESLTANIAKIADKDLKEAAALKRLKFELKDNFPGIVELAEEYEALENAEAKFVKAFEKIDPAFGHIKNNGAALLKLGIKTPDSLDKHLERSIDRTRSYADTDLITLRRVAHEQVKKSTYKTIE